MGTRAGAGSGATWIKVIIMAFIVIAMTFSYSTYSFAQDDIPINIKVRAKDGSEKTIDIKLGPDYMLKEAKVDGKVYKPKEGKVGGMDNNGVISGPQKFPIKIENVHTILDIRPGSIVVFESESVCIPFPDGHGGVYWVGYPPGTRCP